MRTFKIAIFVGCLLAPAFSPAADDELEAVAQDLGAVLAWRLGPESVEK
jgi:hypothetical protein